ncbi:MAG: hypothetical protein KF832_24670 [Caldilineaceae bacterium]|nr:hypothetical protein [Caldilineaceae bacterium]
MRDKPPYFEWPLDGWKLLVLAFCFLLLLLGALFWPEGTTAAIELW